MTVIASIIASITVTFVLSSSLFIYILFNLDKLEKSAKIIIKILSFLFPITKLRNKSIALSVQNQINTYTEKIEKKAPGVMPAALKIEFVKAEHYSVVSKPKEKKIIVRINYNMDRDKIFATTAYLYIKKGFLNRAKYYLDKLTTKSIDISVTKNVLQNSNSLTYFLDNFVVPEITPEIRDLCSKIDYLDEDGFFYEIFVRVMLKVGEENYPNIAPTKLLRETRGFLEALYVVASKLQRQKVPLNYIGEFIKVGIILVYEDEVYQKHGEKPYLDRYLLSMNEGIKIIFFKGIDEAAIDITRNLVKILKKRNHIQFHREVLRPLKMKGGAYKRAIYVYTLPNTDAAEFESNKNKKELINILEREISEIKNKDIEILNIARLKGVLCKVLVKSKKSHINAKNVCIGKELANLKRIGEHIGREQIEFINYNNNMSVLVRDALFSRYQQTVYCKTINIDGVNKYDICVSDSNALSYALDNFALHKRLTDSLLGISSYIKVDNS